MHQIHKMEESIFFASFKARTIVPPCQISRPAKKNQKKEESTNAPPALFPRYSRRQLLTYYSGSILKSATGDARINYKLCRDRAFCKSSRPAWIMYLTIRTCVPLFHFTPQPPSFFTICIYIYICLHSMRGGGKSTCSTDKSSDFRRSLNNIPSHTTKSNTPALISAFVIKSEKFSFWRPPL